MIFRQCSAGDVGRVWSIINDAKRLMQADGRSQWTDKYPSLGRIEADVRSGDAYVLCADDGTAAAYAYITAAPEPVYAALRGRWLAGGAYVVVHRLAVAEAHRGEGLARRMLLMAEDVCRRKGAVSIKVDTNYDNSAMLHLLASFGYSRCGTVSYGPRGERIAFEKIV